ncbi:MAG: DNA repair protein RecO [Clostridia bacterium]|nr:DNA repair protein RecO [Clostridia bacterium]
MADDRYFSVNGIVLKYSDYSESSRILTIFSAEFGLIKAVAKSAKRKGSKLLAISQPFAFCRYQLCRGKNDLHTVTGGELIENFYAVTEDIDRFTAAGEITSDLMANIVRDEPEPEVLRLYLNTLFALCYTKKDPGLIKAVFTVRLRSELGFLPTAEAIRSRYLPGSDDVVLELTEHIVGCDLKKLYGFDISDGLKNTVEELAGKITAEER